MVRTLDSTDVVIEMFGQKTLPADSMKPNYDVEFDCGCGGAHEARSTFHLLCGGFNEFFMLCPNNWVTLVKFRGFFKIKPESKWSCTLRDFDEASR